MPETPKPPEKPPVDAHHFLNVLAHLESLIAAEVIAWDSRSSEQAERRLERLTAAIKHVAHRLSGHD